MKTNARYRVSRPPMTSPSTDPALGASTADAGHVEVSPRLEIVEAATQIGHAAHHDVRELYRRRPGTDEARGPEPLDVALQHDAKRGTAALTNGAIRSSIESGSDRNPPSTSPAGR